VRKIKGFKVVLRPHEVKRRAKKAKLDLEAAGLSDPALNKFLERAAKALAPGVVFDTFGHPDPDQAALSPMPGLAYSVILASLGTSFAEFAPKESGVPEGLWPILEEHGLDATVVFGHTPYRDVWFGAGRKIGLDTGCVYGGRLSCLDLTGGVLHQVARGARAVTSRAVAGELARAR